MTSSPSRRFPRLATEVGEAPPPNPSQAQRAAAPIEPVMYLAGEVIGDRYRLVREVGRGGMGVVWVAHSLVLGVDVALKLIRASAAGPGMTSRMAREAHAAARLGHPALVRVFDFGWTNRGDPFLVMELVQGETLSALLSRDARIPAIRAVQMLLPIVDGLRLAHSKTIVHRDIKPDNIFLAKDTLGRTQPKLIDFGIAKVGPANYDGKLTQVGAVLGSPEYMSPEQALGVDDVDERTDIWSLSIVLYEIITGTIPFKRPNYNALMHIIINEAPKPMPEYGVGDAALWQVIERGLAKKREERWPNVTDFGEALAIWLYEHGIKEDLSGNSIRAVWLDGALSAARADLVPSGAPALSPGSALLGSGAFPMLAGGTEESRQRETLPAHSLLTFRRKRSMVLALVVGVVVGAGGLAVLASIGSRKTPAAPAQTQLTATPIASPQPSALPEPPPEPEAPPALASAKPAAPKLDTGVGRAAPAKAAPRSTPRPVKRSHDFGF
jgi:eukaryotic-like serine/threonine-protein kinase